MKNNKLYIVCIFTFYFLVLLAIGFLVRDIPSQPEISQLTLNQFILESRLNDPKSFCVAALDIAQNGWISPENEWILNLWPPGFIMLQVVILKLFGVNAPVLFIVQILAILLFSVVLTSLYLLSNRLTSSSFTAPFRWFSLFFPLILFIFPFARIFILEPIGVTLGEGLAIGFFFMFIFTLLNAFLTTNWLRYSILSGIFLALSAYFRSHFEIILLFLTCWWCLIALLSKCNTFFVKLCGDNRFNYIKIIGVVLLVSHIATVPWRLYHFIDKGYPAWVSTVLVTLDNSVMTSDYLLENGGRFVVDGGGNLVCRIEPSTCGDREHAKLQFLKVFLTNPLTWYSLKFSVISKYWFSSPNNWSEVAALPDFFDYFNNWIIISLLFLVLIKIASKKYRDQKIWPLLIWINLSLLSSYFLIFTVQQFEVRYFYFPKIFIIFMWLIITPPIIYKLINKKT